MIKIANANTVDTIPTRECFMFISPVSGVKIADTKTNNPIEAIADKIIISSFLSVPIFNISGYIIPAVVVARVKPNS